MHPAATLKSQRATKRRPLGGCWYMCHTRMCQMCQREGNDYSLWTQLRKRLTVGVFQSNSLVDPLGLQCIECVFTRRSRSWWAVTIQEEVFLPRNMLDDQNYVIRTSRVCLSARWKQNAPVNGSSLEWQKAAWIC